MGKKDVGKKTSHQLLPKTLSEAKCPICMDSFRNVATPDCCLHSFCFECIRRWSVVRSVCPLCKRGFLTIYHSIKNDDFKECVTKSWPHPTWDMMRTILPFLRTRNLVAFRRALYRTGVWVQEGDDQSSVSAACLRKDLVCQRRLKLWLRRELTVLYGPRQLLIKRVQRHIMNRITQLDMDDVRINTELYPFLMDHTDQFLHELLNFACSKLSVENYDQQAVYLWRPHNTDSSTSECNSPYCIDIVELKELPIDPMVTPDDTWLNATGQPPFSTLVPQSQLEEADPSGGAPLSADDSSSSSQEEVASTETEASSVPCSSYVMEGILTPGDVRVGEREARGRVLPKRKRQTQQEGSRSRSRSSLNTGSCSSSSSAVSKRPRKRARCSGASSSHGEHLSCQEVPGGSNQSSGQNPTVSDATNSSNLTMAPCVQCPPPQQSQAPRSKKRAKASLQKASSAVSANRAFSSKAPSKRASARKEPTKKTSSKKKSTKTASAKKEPSKRSSAKKELTKKASAKKKPTKSASAKKEPTKRACNSTSKQVMRKRRKIGGDQSTSRSSCGDPHRQREPHTYSSSSSDEEPRPAPARIPKHGRKHKYKRPK